MQVLPLGGQLLKHSGKSIPRVNYSTFDWSALGWAWNTIHICRLDGEKLSQSTLTPDFRTGVSEVTPKVYACSPLRILTPNS
jgi:hypothetical protein